ncbi:DUF3137 domain-containing protein [Flavobacterium sp. ASW18X]|uniref:DUF3137 domain-containing protein n=1 Tax=Flavobacterium sp. ASW18X TaxID=2572595 RepID=UPI0010AE5FF1|nr:DUF3137 domain-containing protein [Flavobacterium sp. ASW18X]TKD61814.1 DUF3137 domain-containing protein [Flavobacterium sp. ASW18X]
MTLKNGKLYLAVPMNKDFFENITVEEKVVKVNSLEAIKEDLNVVQNLITELNISNRIWTKA